MQVVALQWTGCLSPNPGGSRNIPRRFMLQKPGLGMISYFARMRPSPLGGVLGISSDGDDRMEPKVKTQKNPSGYQQNPKKSLDQTLTPQKSYADLVALKSSREG